MENVTQKVSFGFKKTSDKPNFLKNNSESIKEVKKIELIDSIEGTTLKVIGKDPKDDEKQILVIALTDDQKTRPISKLIESRKNSKRSIKEKSNGEIPKTENETLEQKAAREILEDLQNTTITTENKSVLELPIHPDELPLNGAIESTVDDYEKVPIADFGKAMLRGMGWKDEDKKEDLLKFDAPVVRPKGLGLGADKVIKKQKLLVQPAANETLEIKRNACIKVLAGKHKNLYGTIEGFDDGGGRLVIKLAIGGIKVQMNEFMVQPVPKQEFAKYSKILNSEKYDEYKNEGNKTSNPPEKSSVKEERRSRSLSPSTSKGRDGSRASYKSKDESSTYRARDDNRRNKSSERNRSRERRGSRERTSNYNKKDTRHYSSDSEDDKTYNRKYNERRRSRSHEKHRKRYSSSDSSSERHKSKKKSSKKSSKSKSKKNESPERYYSSEDERKHRRKYKRSKHHRDRS